jgi:hypothetical protein
MNAEIKPIRWGNIYGSDRGTGFAGNIWDKEFISPTVTTCGGGNREPMIMEIVYEQAGNNNSGYD